MVTHNATTNEHSCFTQRHDATTNEHSCFTQRHDATTTEHCCFTRCHDATTTEHCCFTQRHDATTTEHCCFTQRHEDRTLLFYTTPQRHKVYMEHVQQRYILTLWRCVNHFDGSFAIRLFKQPRWITDTISSTRLPPICLVGCSRVPGILHVRACWGTISRGNRRPTSLPAEKWRKGLRGNWPGPVH